jgi:thioredoxin-like negative regulator of GroEL
VALRKAAAKPEPDLLALLELAVRRDRLRMAGGPQDDPQDRPRHPHAQSWAQIARKVVVPALARAGQLDEARAVAESFDPSDRDRDTVLVVLAEALTRAGHRAQALTIVTALSSSTYRCEGLGAVARALAEAGELDTAENLLGAEARTTPERVMVLKTLAPLAARAGDLERALRLTDSLTTAREYPNTLFEVARDTARAGQAGPALAIAASIEHEATRWCAYSYLAGALAAAGRFEDAEDLLTTVPEPYWRDGGAAMLIKELAVAGRFEQATRLMAGLEHPTWRMNAPIELATVLSEHGRGEDGEALARSQGGSSRDRALSAVVDGLMSRGDLAPALAIARSYQAPREELARANTFRRIAAALAEAGRMDDALSVLAELSGLPRYMPGDLERVCESTLPPLALGAARSGHPSARDLTARSLLGNEWHHTLEPLLLLEPATARTVVEAITRTIPGI